jgi:hypothetical protein
MSAYPRGNPLFAYETREKYYTLSRSSPFPSYLPERIPHPNKKAPAFFKAGAQY